MAEPTNAREALIAEMLGDVLRLDDAIKQLPNQLAPTLGAVLKAAKELEARAAELSASAKAQHDAHAQQVVATYANNIGRMVEQHVERALDARVGKVAKQLEQAISKTNAEALQFVEAARSPWMVLGSSWLIAICLGLCGGVISAAATLYATVW